MRINKNPFLFSDLFFFFFKASCSYFIQVYFKYTILTLNCLYFYWGYLNYFILFYLALFPNICCLWFSINILRRRIKLISNGIWLAWFSLKLSRPGTGFSPKRKGTMDAFDVSEQSVSV